MPAATVAGVVLAAGEGSRMGHPKALVEVGGTPLVARGVGTLQGGGCDPVGVVVGAAAAEVRGVVESAVPDAVVIHNPRWSEGLATSVRAALRWVATTDATALVLLPVDTPGITAAVVDRLRQRSADTDDALVATYGGRPRNPVLLPAAVWPDVAASVQGDAGARHWLRSDPGRVEHVDCSDVGDPTDLDTQHDLRRWNDTPAASGGPVARPASPTAASHPGEHHGT